MDFKKTPRTEGGAKVQAASIQGFQQAFLEFVALALRENYSSNFPGTFLEFSLKLVQNLPQRLFLRVPVRGLELVKHLSENLSENCCLKKKFQSP